MNLTPADLNNICEALEQMEFRCARNLYLIEDVIQITGDQNARLEQELLQKSLDRYQTTLFKIKALQKDLL